MSYYPGPLSVEVIKQFEGRPRLLARRCEGDAWEVGWGSTYYEDSSSVKKGDTIDEDRAERMLLHCMSVEAAPVWEALNFEPNQHQIDALASLAYNIGGSAAAGSSVVIYANEGRFEDAAASFGMWSGATTRFNSDGSPIMAPDGTLCEYFRRFRGLLRRHHAEGCLFLGYDWKDACHNDAIAMRTEKRWNDKKRRWQDYIISQTEFKEVVATARKHPLPSLTPEPSPVVPEPTPEPVAPKPPQHKEAAPVAENIVIDVPVGDPNKPIILVPTEHVFDKTLDPKPIELSDTFKYAVTELVGVWLKNTAGKTGVVGSFATLAWPLYQSMAKTPEAQMVLTWVIVSAVSASVGGLGWAAGKVIETAGIKGKEQARVDGVQLKY